MTSATKPTVSLAEVGEAEQGHTTALTGFPPDLLAQSARRLRILALIYAVVFFLNRYGPALVDRLFEELPLELGRHWILTI